MPSLPSVRARARTTCPAARGAWSRAGRSLGPTSTGHGTTPSSLPAPHSGHSGLRESSFPPRRSPVACRLHSYDCFPPHSNGDSLRASPIDLSQNFPPGCLSFRLPRADRSALLEDDAALSSRPCRLSQTAPVKISVACPASQRHRQRKQSND